jgi:hypothetical protein
MKDERITLATAKLCKEKGYNISCNGSYTEFLKTHKSDNPSFAMKKGEVDFDDSFFFMNNNSMCDYSNENYTMYAAPSQSLLQRWLRDTHKLHIEIILGHDEKQTWYDFYVYKIELGYDDDFIADSSDMDDNGSYEETLETGLQEALKLMK